MIRKLLTGLSERFNDPESKHRLVIRKVLAKHRSKKLHKAILAGKAPRGRTV